jgi:nanoRNase/pAp phosphatase (c-di-AMP/oligoRNAs hydrolase)
MPDDDAICSALAQKRILKRLYPEKNIKVIFSNKKIDAWDNFLEDPDEINWANSSKIKGEDSNTRMGDIIDHLKDGDTLIGTDAGKFSSFSKFPELIEQKPGLKTAILDHHKNAPSIATASYVEPTATSASELIANMYGVDTLTPQESELLLLGILSDTQDFEVPADYSQTRPLAEQLRIKSGKSFDEIKGKVKSSEQQDEYKKAYAKHIKKFQKPNSLPQTYSYISFKDRIATKPTTNSDYDHFIARREFMKDLTNTGDTELYWTASPIGGPKGTNPIERYSVMFRRSPSSKLDLNALAMNFGGGGHEGAASGSYELSVDQQKMLKELKLSNPKLSESEYVCGLIAEEIATKLESKAPEPEKLPTPMSQTVAPAIEQKPPAIPTAKIHSPIAQTLTNPAEKHPAKESRKRKTFVAILRTSIKALIHKVLL